MPLEEDPLVFAVPRDCEVLKGKCVEGNSLGHPLELNAHEFCNPNLTYLLSTSNHSLCYADFPMVII